MTNPDISYIIVNYNVKEYITAALQSVYSYTSPYSFEVIVTDNNSSDGSVEEIKKKFPEVIIIENDYNAGFSAANNQAFSIASGKYLFMLNPDAELKENCIEKMIEAAGKYSGNCLFGPMLTNTNGSFQRSYWNIPSSFSILAEFFFINYAKKFLISSRAPLDVKEVECVSGAAMLFSINLYNSVGGLDPDLFWMDDTDFCFRIRKDEGKVIYVPHANVVHHIGKSSQKNQKVTISGQVISRIKFYRKHGMMTSFYLSVIFSFILIVEKMIMFALISVFTLPRRKLAAYFYTFKVFMKYLTGNKVT